MRRWLLIVPILISAQYALSPDEVAQRLGAILIAQNDCGVHIPAEVRLRQIVKRWGWQLADFQPDGQYGGLVELHASRTIFYLAEKGKKMGCRELRIGLHEVLQ